jgi:hypothetical protein
MGTRGAYGFRVGGKDTIFYNGHDSYPQGLGQEVVDWVKANLDNFNVLREIAKQFNPSDEEYEPECGAKGLHLTILLKTGAAHNDFLKNSLFCEYAYIVNFDTNNLELYRGANRNKSTRGRYADFRIPTIKYHGVYLVGEFDFSNIPDNWKDIFKGGDDDQTQRHP